MRSIPSGHVSEDRFTKGYLVPSVNSGHQLTIDRVTLNVFNLPESVDSVLTLMFVLGVRRLYGVCWSVIWVHDLHPYTGLLR